jgi:signal transduction histidine kinase
MDTLIYASIPIIIGLGVVCLMIGIGVGTVFWSFYYRRQRNHEAAKPDLNQRIAVNELIRDLKHQLGNYLNIIKHQLVVMRGEMNQLPAQQRDRWTQQLGHSLDNISYYEWRMTQLIENLDFVAHLENPDAVFSFSEVKPDVIVDDVVRDLYERAEARRVELSWWARPELFPRITANHDALRQALINVIDNTIKYAAPKDEQAPKGEVDIALNADDSSTITIRISDNGPGIPPDDLPRLFDKDYTSERVRGRRPNEGGMGLGLYIVKSVAEKHQGWVKIESQVGQGTAVTLVLPVRRL